MKKYLFLIIILVLFVGIVEADTFDTIIIYPSVAGIVGTNITSSYTTVRNNVGNTSNTTSNLLSGPLISSTSITNQYGPMQVGVFSIDTSVVGNRTINSAIFSVQSDLKAIGSGVSSYSANVTSGTLANYNVIVPTDYQGRLNGSDLAPSIDYSDWQTSTADGGVHNNFSFSPYGISYINKTGYTVIFLRDSIDTTNNSGSWVSSQTFRFRAYYPSDSIPSRRPYLVLNVTTPDTTSPASITNLTSTVTNSSIIWDFKNPISSNFNLTMIWKDGLFDQNITNSSHGLIWSGLSPHTTHTISTKTVSINGYVNSTWVNGSATTDYALINANFTGTPLTGIAALTVSFSDLSSDTPTNWLWNFGDGNTSSLKNPSNTYSLPGVYSVSLNASNPQFFSNFSRTNYITVTAPTTSPTPTPTTPPPTTTSPTPTPTPLPGGQWIIFTDNITQSSITWNMSNKAAPLTFVSLDGKNLTGFDPNATIIIQSGLAGGETHSISAIANNTTSTATATTKISAGETLINLVSDWFPVFIILGLFAFGVWLHWLIFFIGSGVSLYFLYDWIQRYPIQTVGIGNLHFLVYAALFILGLILWLFKRKGR